MDEEVWRESVDVEAMLGALDGRATEGQLRAFAAACTYETWVAQYEPGGPFEHFARDDERIDRSRIGDWVEHRWRYARSHEVHLLDGFDIARSFAHSARRVIGRSRPMADDTDARLAQFLRCVLANPFHAVMFDPAWREWNNGTVVKLAHAVRDDRRYDLVLILGDALQDAGCGDPDVVAHCRRPLPHTVDCWLFRQIFEESRDG